MGDMTYPYKLLFPEFSSVEKRLYKKLSKKFGFSPEVPREVHLHDIRIRATEKRDLKKNQKQSPDIEPHDFVIKAWGWRKSKEEFLKRYEELKP